jgi:hypothetical protein
VGVPSQVCTKFTMPSRESGLCCISHLLLLLYIYSPSLFPNSLFTSGKGLLPFKAAHGLKPMKPVKVSLYPTHYTSSSKLIKILKDSWKIEFGFHVLDWASPSWRLQRGYGFKPLNPKPLKQWESITICWQITQHIGKQKEEYLFVATCHVLQTWWWIKV